MKLSEILLTIYLWTLFIPVLLFANICFLLLYPFVKKERFTKIFEILLLKTMLYSMVLPGFWKVKITDLRKIKNKNYIIISNHVSFIDSVILASVPLTKKYIIANMFTKIPLFGWLTKLAGFISADRNNEATSNRPNG